MVHYTAKTYSVNWNLTCPVTGARSAVDSMRRHIARVIFIRFSGHFQSENYALVSAAGGVRKR
jgi:hypothetical protein